MSYNQAMTIQDMARHMAEHNTEATTAVTMVATQTLATSEDSPPTPEGGGLTQRWKK
ncbi:MAG: hypothetical protein J5616_08360 [Bacteroidaceae bacterium]|nr:hypothetical protein [Bacteroidaceae bacterium]